MKNSDKEIRSQKVSKELAKLRQLREFANELFALVPNLMDIGSLKEIASEEERKRALSLSIRVSASSGAYWDSLPSMIPANAEEQENIDWYENVLPSVREKTRYLMTREIAPNPDGTAYVPARAATAGPGKKFKTAFSKVADFVYEYLDSLDGDEFEYLVDEEGMSAVLCQVIIEMPYFKPDEWFANGGFAPVTFNPKLQNIPKHVRQRVEEIRHSFIFGNWAAVIALSRCLLEYALVERKHLKIKVYKDQNKTRVQPLEKLIAGAKKTYPELGEDMHRIQDAGNGVMHPAGGNIKQFPPNKNSAKKCVAGITKIVSILYSK